MEGRTGLSRPAFFVGASLGLWSDHARSFTVLRDSGGRKRGNGGSTIQALAWLDLMFLQELPLLVVVGKNPNLLLSSLPVGRTIYLRN